MTAERLASTEKRFGLRTLGLLLLPLLLLAGVIALFLGRGGMHLESAAPVESLSVERYALSHGEIRVFVRNTGAEPLTIAQVIINDAVWPFMVHPSPTLARLERGVIAVNYPWSLGEAYGLAIFTSNSIAFNVDIPVAFETPAPSSAAWASPCHSPGSNR